MYHLQVHDTALSDVITHAGNCDPNNFHCTIVTASRYFSS